MSTSSQESDSVVVIDAGSGILKAGFAGDDAPIFCCSSVTGVFKYADDMGMGTSETFVGDKAEDKCNLLTLQYPIKRGIVTDWDNAEKLFNHTFKGLRVDPTEISVLMSEPMLNPMANREKMTQLMFESFNLRRFQMNSSSTFGIFAYGRSAGMVIDIGEGVTTIGVHYEVFSIPYAMKRQEFAGHDLTHILQKVLYQKGLSFSTPSELELVRKVKENVCYSPVNIYGKDPYESLIPNSYTLPDGHVIKLTNEERAKCADAIFDPGPYVGQNVKGLHELVYDCFQNIENDVRNNYYCNMLLLGGTSCMPGLPEKLQNEMEKLLPSTRRVKVVDAPERKYNVWIGGSILGSLSTYKDVPMTKADYEEFGPSIVHRRFL